jgi:hypothetical protein
MNDKFTHCGGKATVGLVQQKYCCNWGLTEKQSSAVHIQALVSADGIL